ncbi:hypothetical protein FH609_030170 [Streptomyces sp. 3MP-14]|uniref:Rieske domain-containing protein n=1 Tax=Streptomyces mimosae TaxID=2586635 RepID=A0A5N5ZN23_9ACTN|nr:MULTISPECIES: hypothetical protein [Streptomyces]KAB8157897.1 hypothetical protein FH607_029760 [Streptomyces mimosae]KAB8172398.1 hypothetical protein FH609_030170 [Streptomyces sp. 3MP-14]
MRKAIRFAVPAALAAALLMTACDDEEASSDASSSGGSEGGELTGGSGGGSDGADETGPDETDAPDADDVEGAWYVVEDGGQPVKLQFILGEAVLHPSADPTDTCHGLLDQGLVTLGGAAQPCPAHAGADGSPDVSEGALALDGETLTVAWRDGRVEEFERLPDALYGENIGALDEDELARRIAESADGD